jgi:hypothetical protein
MAVDGFREPTSMVPIAVRDYLRFGALRSLSLFKVMTSYPTLERVRNLVMPTLVIAGDRDPLVRIDRAHVFAGLPNVHAVKVRGAHALNYSEPELIASLLEAHLAGRPIACSADGADSVEILDITRRPYSRTRTMVSLGRRPCRAPGGSYRGGGRSNGEPTGDGGGPPRVESTVGIASSRSSQTSCSRRRRRRATKSLAQSMPARRNRAAKP